MNLPISYRYILAKTVHIASVKPSSRPAAADPDPEPQRERCGSLTHALHTYIPHTEPEQRGHVNFLLYYLSCGLFHESPVGH